MKMFYVIPMCMMLSVCTNGFVADIGVVAMNTTDFQNITSITNTTESPYYDAYANATKSHNVSTSTTYPTYIGAVAINTKKNYTTNSTSDGMRYSDSKKWVSPIIGSCMLYTLSQF